MKVYNTFNYIRTISSHDICNCNYNEMIEVIAAIILKDQKVLIARRGSEKHLAGYWEFPGGKLEENETEEECLKREIKEELGVEILVDSFFMKNQHKYGTKEILLMSYRCSIVSINDFTLIDHDKVEWVEINNLNQYEIAPADISIVKALIDGTNDIRANCL